MEVWGEIEVKVRRLVKDLIEPTVLRVMENKESIERLQKFTSEDSKRLDEQVLKMQVTTDKLQIINDFSKKLVEISASNKALDLKIERERISNKTMLEEVHKKFVTTNESIQVLEHQRQQMRGEVSHVEHHLAQLKGFVDDKIHEFSNTQVDKHVEVDTRIDYLGEKIDQFSLNLDKFNDYLGDVDLLTKQAYKQTSKNKTAIKTLIKNSREVENELKDNIEKNRVVEAANALACRQSIDEILVFTKVELPIVFTVQSNDLMLKINSDSLARKKIAESEIEALQKYDNVDMPKHIEEIYQNAKNRSTKILGPRRKLNRTNTIRNTGKSNNSGKSPNNRQAGPQHLQDSSPDKTKKVSENTPHKRTDSGNPVHIPTGGSIEHSKETDDRRDEKQHSDFLQLERADKTEDIEEYENSENSEKEDYLEEDHQYDELNNMIIELQRELEEMRESSAKDLEAVYSSREAEINKIYEHTSKELENMKTANEALFNAVNEDIRDHHFQLKSHKEELENHQSLIDKNFQDNESLSVELKDYFSITDKFLRDNQKNIELCWEEYRSQATKRRKELADISNEFKSTNGNIEHISDSISKAQEHLSRLLNSERNIIEALQIQAMLDLHDEKDRDSIALIGFTDKKQKTESSRWIKNPPRPVVSIDKQCISCTNPSTVTVNAFKMACLTYTPSQITYKQSIYSRMELIHAKKKLLEGIASQGIVGILENIKMSRPNTSVPVSSRFRTPTSVINNILPSPFLAESTEPFEFPRLTPRIHRTNNSKS